MNSKYLNANQLFAIGKVAANWNALESAIKWLIWSMAKIDAMVGTCFTQNMNSAQLYDIALALSEFCIDPKHITEFKEIMSEYNDLRTQRNTILHSNWMETKKDSNEILRTFKVTARKKLSIKTLEFTADEIERIAISIQNLNVRALNYFVNSGLQDQLPLPQKFPSRQR